MILDNYKCCLPIIACHIDIAMIFGLNLDLKFQMVLFILLNFDTRTIKIAQKKLHLFFHEEKKRH